MSRAVEDRKKGREQQKKHGRGEKGTSTLSSAPSEQSTNNANQKLPKSEVFDILSADRRQEVLRYLDQSDGTADLGELAEHIAAIECDCDRAQLSSQQRKRVYVGLYQCHLPKMADAGVIEYDPDRGTVALNDRSFRLLDYLYFEEEHDPGVCRGLLNRLLK